jgi:sensor histidine kinase regulating citrate/malate metabolism
MADDSEKRIRFEIKQAGQFFNIRLSNTYQDDTDKKTGPRVFKAGSRNTSKKDKDLHGYGSINIMDTVEKYNGMIKEESKDSVFTLSIMLPK